MELDVRIGAARAELSGASREGSLRLVVPADLLKREEGTWIWSDRSLAGDPAIVKVYAQRSRRSRIRGRLWSLRVQREYRCLELLRRRDVACTEPLLWGMGESRELGRFEILATREVPGVVSLRDGVRASGVVLTPSLLRAVFREVRALHRAGIFHRVLSWKNVLVGTRSDEDPRVYMVDMAKAIPFSRDLAGTSRARYDLLYLCGHIEGVVAREEMASSLADAYGMPADRVPSFLRRLDRWRREGRLARRLRSAWLVVRSRLDPSRIPPR